MGDQIPKVADLPLQESVNPAEALLDPVGVPREIVIYHQVGPLEIYTLSRSISGDKNIDVRIVEKCLLGIRPNLSRK